MATSSISGSMALSSGIWAQMQQQQAQRAADQADLKAQALRAQANDAQAVAAREQEKARSLRVESDQAESQAGGARLALASMKSMSVVQGRLSDLHTQLSSTSLPTVASTAITKAPVAAAAAVSGGSVVNALGQVTGTLLSVTA